MNQRTSRAIDIMAGKRVYFDSCTFIFFLERHAIYFETTAALMHACSKHLFFGVTGAVAIAEVMVHPYRTDNQKTIAQTKLFFEQPQFLTVLSHRDSLFDSAAQICAHQRLKTLDALHLATAIDGQCDFFLTNDFKFKSSAHITVMQLDDLLSD